MFGVKIRWRWLLAGTAAVALLAQFFRPARTNPPVAPGHDLLTSNAPPREIAGLLRTACYDCHSAETKWPWYSQVSPVSWFLVSHVNEGRQRLNFSDWPHADPQRAARKWNRISDQVGSGDMPLSSYTWLHPAARLSAEQRDRLANWAGQQARRLQASAADQE